MTTETETPSLKEQIAKGGMDDPDAKIVVAKNNFKSLLIVYSYILVYFFSVFDFFIPKDETYRFYVQFNLGMLFFVTTYLAWDRGMLGRGADAIINIHNELCEWRTTFATMDAEKVIFNTVIYMLKTFVAYCFLCIFLSIEFAEHRKQLPIARILLFYIPCFVLLVYVFWLHFPLLKRFFYA